MLILIRCLSRTRESISRRFAAGPWLALAKQAIFVRRSVVLALAITAVFILYAGGRPAAVEAMPIEPETTMSYRQASPIDSVVIKLRAPSLMDVMRASGVDANDPLDFQSFARGHAAELDVAAAQIHREQATVTGFAEALGMKVVSRYEAVVAGMLIHGPRDQLVLLATHPLVARVEPAPRVRLDLTRSVPHIGARFAAQELGFNGRGTHIAIIDAGIDYTHGQLGGPGTSAAYREAVADAESIDEIWQGEPLFPSQKVVGGYDFVGPKYTHPSDCSEQDENAGKCTGTPHPDPDPIDQHGHGSHVAGIAAGNAIASLGNGVAPGARLVALKIYGPPDSGIGIDEEVDIVIDALDWCAKVNMAREVPGIAPPIVDVINMSLGEPYGQAATIFDEAMNSTVDARIVVVSSAGNAGNTPFITGAPGASRKVISVANSQIIGSGEAGIDQMASSSSRGPSRHGAFKPNIAAPGATITSASFSTGDRGRQLSGTSMASPHIAGAAAVLRQRSRAEGIDLSPREIGALLMNTATFSVERVGSQSGLPAKASRQGAGIVGVAAAAQSPVVAISGDIAAIHESLNAGTTRLSTTNHSIELRNLIAEDLIFEAELYVPLADQVDWLSIDIADELKLEAGTQRAFDLRLSIHPEMLPDWPFRNATVSATALDTLEIDGQLRLFALGEDGQRMSMEQSLAIPFRVLARKASDIQPFRTNPARPPGDESPPGPTLIQTGFAGSVDLFLAPTLLGDQVAIDPDEPEIAHELDLAGVGLRYVEDGIEIALTSYVPASIPWLTLSEVFIDIDDDGLDDHRIRVGPRSILAGGRLSPALGMGITPWDGAQNSPAGVERVDDVAGYDLYSSIIIMSASYQELGLSGPVPLNIRALRHGLSEDWLAPPFVDHVPDLTPNGTPHHLKFDLDRMSYLPHPWSVDLPASLNSPLTHTVNWSTNEGAIDGAVEPGLLLVYRDNPPDRQYEWYPFPNTPDPILLPILRRNE